MKSGRRLSGANPELMTQTSSNFCDRLRFLLRGGGLLGPGRAFVFGDGGPLGFGRGFGSLIRAVAVRFAGAAAPPEHAANQGDPRPRRECEILIADEARAARP